jgi:hypothetical protein
MAVKPRPDRQQDVANEKPERSQSHEQARQRPVAPRATNQADGRRERQTNPRHHHQDRQAEREDRLRVSDLRGRQCRRQADGPEPGTPDGEYPSSQHRQTHGHDVIAPDVQ